MGVWLKPTFHATPLPLCHETSVCTLEVSALIRGSLPRPWGEGGRSDGGRGGRVRVNPRELLPKMSELQNPAKSAGLMVPENTERYSNIIGDFSRPKLFWRSRYASNTTPDND